MTSGFVLDFYYNIFTMGYFKLQWILKHKYTVFQDNILIAKINNQTHTHRGYFWNDDQLPINLEKNTERI